MHLENMFYIQGDIHVIIIIKIVCTCILFHTCICRLIPFEPLLQQLLFRKKKSLLILISFKKKISAEFSLHVVYFCNRIPQVNICQFIFILGYASRYSRNNIFWIYSIIYVYKYASYFKEPQLLKFPNDHYEILFSSCSQFIYSVIFKCILLNII